MLSLSTTFLYTYPMQKESYDQVETRKKIEIAFYCLSRTKCPFICILSVPATQHYPLRVSFLNIYAFSYSLKFLMLGLNIQIKRISKTNSYTQIHIYKGGRLEGGHFRVENRDGQVLPRAGSWLSRLPT